MCTITFIPKQDQDFILTSNRDEAPGRETFPPKIYGEEGIKLLYPKDAQAGGTWIGASDRKRLVTLMNGGFEAHERKAHYRKSRGLVVKDFLRSENLGDAVESYDFSDIEPFTAIMVAWHPKLQLFQLVWDGTDYHFSEENVIPRIWSSSPLYPEKLRKKRDQWFSEFLKNANSPSATAVLDFHRHGGEGNLHADLVMDRGLVKTKSITQIEKKGDRIGMFYEDLQTGQTSLSQFPF